MQTQRKGFTLLSLEDTRDKRGFTLLELLIVIGILAVLASATAVVLNPAELLKQARDTQRLNDLDSVKSALALYATDNSSPAFTAGPFSTANATCGFSVACTVRAVYVVDNTTAWVPINLQTGITGGSPIPAYPRDPKNDATYQYAYMGDDANDLFELNTRLESTKFRTMMQTDGGDDSACTTWTGADCYYETGTKAGLNL